MRFSNILRYYLSPVTSVAAVAAAIAAKFAFDGGSSDIEGYPNSLSNNIDSGGFAMGGSPLYPDTWPELWSKEESAPSISQKKDSLQPKFIKLKDGTVIPFEKDMEIQVKVIKLTNFCMVMDGTLHLMHQLAYKAKNPSHELSERTLSALIASGLLQTDGTFDPETHCYLKQLLIVDADGSVDMQDPILEKIYGDLPVESNDITTYPSCTVSWLQKYVPVKSNDYSDNECFDMHDNGITNSYPSCTVSWLGGTKHAPAEADHLI